MKCGVVQLLWLLNAKNEVGGPEIIKMATIDKHCEIGVCFSTALRESTPASQFFNPLFTLFYEEVNMDLSKNS